MDKSELKNIASQLLTGMLANPHIYANVSDEGAAGQQEKKLVTIAIDMAEKLIIDIENRLNS